MLKTHSGAECLGVRESTQIVVDHGQSKPPLTHQVTVILKMIMQPSDIAVVLFANFDVQRCANVTNQMNRFVLLEGFKNFWHSVHRPYKINWLGGGLLLVRVPLLNIWHGQRDGTSRPILIFGAAARDVIAITAAAVGGSILHFSSRTSTS